MPLQLAAHQHRFSGDAEALAAYLIDEAPEGWSYLGTDLLDGAPDALRQHLAGERDEPGSRYPAHRASPPLICTERTSSGLGWSYVLHPRGIEVISRPGAERGSVVTWDTDPRVRFRDTASLWRPDQPIPATTPPCPTVRTASPATTSPSAPTPRKTARR
ncbi:hypothetical protein [Streptomyces sp. NPDC048637]|uniref:hypothetical protein n=1 Tax=Streptomyces sp. NPDC048637 TaxID=3155636 RepID=UPI00343E9ADB